MTELEVVKEMRHRDAVLLVSCYELGRQPLGIVRPMGFLQRAGFSPSGLDVAQEGPNLDRFGQAWFVGISVPMHTALRLGVELARRVRQINSKCHICFYGLYASLNSEYLLQTCADSVLAGEYEEALVELVEALEQGIPLEAIEGLSRRGQAAGPILKRLDFTKASRAGLAPLGKHARLEHQGQKYLAGYVEASRGCRHMCLHCPIPPVYGGRFFVVDKEIVLEDIRVLVRKGAQHITFADADFLNGPGHSQRIVRAMHNEFPELTFDFTAKVEHLLKYRDLLPQLARSGCLFVVSAIESLSDTVLTNLKKRHTRADILDTLALLRSCGITFRPSLVAFTPWTTFHDYLDILEFVEMEKLIDHVEPVQFSIRLLVPPGSHLLSEPSLMPHLEELDQPSFTYRWRHPDPRMDRLQTEVAAAVEQANCVTEDVAVTFERIKRLAFLTAKCSIPPGPPQVSAPNRVRPPRLTESWFC